VTLSEIETATFWLGRQCINQLPHATPPCKVTVGYGRTNVIGSRTSFVISLFILAYIEIYVYVFRSNLFQAHSLQQSYHPTLTFKQEKFNIMWPVYRQATGWMVRGSNPGGDEIFRSSPDRPWGPTTLLYSGYRILPGGRKRPGRDADPSPPSSAEV
jgi:hypothetical protein